MEERSNIQCYISIGKTLLHNKIIYKVDFKHFCYYLCYFSKCLVPDVQMEDIADIICYAFTSIFNHIMIRITDIYVSINISRSLYGHNFFSKHYILAHAVFQKISTNTYKWVIYEINFEH